MSAELLQTFTTSMLSSQETSRVSEYLVTTRDRLIEATSNLSDPQWHFKPGPESWSIAEILEHVVIIEGRVHAIIGRMPGAPLAEADRMNWQLEEMIRTKVPDRSEKITAPPPVQPSHQWSPAETLPRFLERRARTLELLTEATSLRGHVVLHPILGPLDGYQWILAVAAHTDRHISQILEVKGCSGFPEGQSLN
ncbi:MAG TPA: DinB family protein [Bryobacteraceae bacterium]|nr:DinB family protein [Bryobacteraceae bacterium]